MKILTFEGHIWYLELTSENWSIILFLVEALQQVLPRFRKTTTYPVSDTYPIRVQVRFMCDMHPILQLAYRSILTTLIHPDMSRYASDTSMIFFSRYFGGFGQEYAPYIRRYAPILLWYVPEWNLYHVLYFAIVFQLFIYQ
jgi:hypothetical protein